MTLIQNLTYNPINNLHWGSLTENTGKLRTALDTVTPLLVLAPTRIGQVAHLALSAFNIWNTHDDERRLFLAAETALVLINTKAGLVAHTSFSLIQNMMSMIQKFNRIEPTVANVQNADADMGNNDYVQPGALDSLRNILFSDAASHALTTASDVLTLLPYYVKFTRKGVLKVALAQAIFQLVRSTYVAFKLGKETKDNDGWKAFPFIAQLILLRLHLERAYIADQTLQRFGYIGEEFVVMRTADQKGMDETAPQTAENITKVMAEHGKTRVNFLVSEHEGARATAEKLSTMVKMRSITVDPRLNILSQESVKSGNTHSSKEDPGAQSRRMDDAIVDELQNSRADELVVVVGHQRPLLSFLRCTTGDDEKKVKIDHSELKVMQLYNDDDEDLNAEILKEIKIDPNKPKTKDLSK